MLDNIYTVFETEVASIDFACSKGCSTCCTQSVTMTTAEGRLIMGFLERVGEVVPELPDTSTRPKPTYTTNGLAASCLEERDLPAESNTPWVYDPCIFLKNDLCSIYSVRPFSCRSFGSLINCAETGAAEVPDWFISLNTLVSQLLEHLDRGGWWGNMIDVLIYLEEVKGRAGMDILNGSERLLATEPVPGLLIMPKDLPVIDNFLVRLAEATRGEDEFEELVKEIRATLQEE